MTIEDRDTETWPYLVRRDGWRWRIFQVQIDHDDRIVSETHPALRYWRWITAARTATTLRRAFWYGRSWPLELGDLS